MSPLGLTVGWGGHRGRTVKQGLAGDGPCMGRKEGEDIINLELHLISNIDQQLVMLWLYKLVTVHQKCLHPHVMRISKQRTIAVCGVSIFSQVY